MMNRLKLLMTQELMCGKFEEFRGEVKKPADQVKDLEVEFVEYF